MTDEYFRASVGILMVNRARQVLALERIDSPGSWQAPQGGISRDEKPVDAAARELFEETGIRWSSVDVIHEYPGWLAYELPASARSEKTGLGQVQKWFLVAYLGEDHDIMPSGGDESPEFSDWQWMPIAELVSGAWEPRQFVYDSLAHYWASRL